MTEILKNKYLWLGVIAGLIVGDIIGVALFKNKDVREDAYIAQAIRDLEAGQIANLSGTSTPMVSDSETRFTPTYNPSQMHLYSLSVSKQKAGSSVVVSDVRVGTSTWLAVREHNGDLLGNILGARRVSPGFTRQTNIELLRSTKPYVMYAVVMYEDNGDGVFDHQVDALLQREIDLPLLYPFKTE